MVKKGRERRGEEKKKKKDAWARDERAEKDNLTIFGVKLFSTAGRGVQLLFCGWDFVRVFGVCEIGVVAVCMCVLWCS